jgi:hypothetical protein
MAKLSRQEYVALCDNLNKEIENAYQAIKGLSDTYKEMMEGDGQVAHWSGATALAFFNKAKGNLDNAITAYNEATDAWVKLYNRYMKLLEKSYFK